MITKYSNNSAGAITKDVLDEKSNSKTITGNTQDVSIHTLATFLYSHLTQPLLVKENVIDYETQLALREKWKNLTITDNFLFEKVMRNKRVYG